MKAIFQPLRRLALQILFLLLCFFLSRCLFTVINLDKFHGLTLPAFLRLSFFALRYDISAIVTINAVYIILLLLPIPFWKFPWFEKGLQWLFVITNSIAFAFEISDWAYFPFALKRSTVDVLDMIGRKSDFLNQLPHFLKDYWYAPLGIAVLVWGLYKANKRICRKTAFTPSAAYSWSVPAALGQTLSLALVTGLGIIAMRGGLQLIPLGNGNALQVSDNQFVPIVLNTPFSMMHSYSGKLEEVKYFEDNELKKYFDPIKQYNGKEFRRKNVVYIILESFSKEFTSIGGRKTFTPFLDSLMKHSYVCRNAYANALHSAEGIPAVISGIPSLMEEPVTTSSYGTNKLTSLPALLRDKGYETAFYHGGTNGTMSFDIYAAGAGFSRYFGRKEYNNERDYDGNWGIWDEPFLQYFARGLNGMKQPFMASVFTLSSHDPFRVPAKYKELLPDEGTPIERTIAYTDYSLREFFKTASQQEWFQNTLFVITADHSSPISDDPYYSSPNMGRYAIPILFYAPGDTLPGSGTDQVMQQIDILPSVLDYLGYSEKFFAFGNSIFRSAYPRFVINELSGRYQWYMDGYLLTANELEPKGLYYISTDSLCRDNLLEQPQEKAQQKIISYFKAFVQLYRSAVIHNRLSVENIPRTN